jgi:hypothetical protein
MRRKEKVGCADLKEIILKEKDNFPKEAKDDLAKGIKELIEVENHARYSYQVTGNKRWLEILKTVRKIRGRWQTFLEREEEGYGKTEETHCLSKHILSGSKRLEEVGDKLLDANFNEEIVEQIYRDAKVLYDIFFIVNDKKFVDEEANR